MKLLPAACLLMFAVQAVDLIVSDNSRRVLKCKYPSSTQECVLLNNYLTTSKSTHTITSIETDTDGNFIMADFSKKVVKCPPDPTQKCEVATATFGKHTIALHVHSVTGDFYFNTEDGAWRCPKDASTIGADLANCGSSAFWDAGGTWGDACGWWIGEDTQGNIMASSWGHVVVKCPLENGVAAKCSNFIGDGTKGKAENPAKLDGPRDVTIDSNGDYIVADSNNKRVLRCPAASPTNCVVVVDSFTGLYPTKAYASPSNPDSYIIMNENPSVVIECPKGATKTECTVLVGAWDKTAPGDNSADTLVVGGIVPLNKVQEIYLLGLPKPGGSAGVPGKTLTTEPNTGCDDQEIPADKKCEDYYTKLADGIYGLCADFHGQCLVGSMVEG